MAQPRKVAVYGNSLFLAGVEVGLRAIAGLEVVRVDASASGALIRLLDAHPDAIIFELSPDAPLAALALPFLAQSPDRLLIGLDANTYEVVVVSSQQVRADSVSDLAAVIQAPAGVPV